MSHDRRQASADEIYSEEVTTVMVAAGMSAHRQFDAASAGPDKTRAEMVARVYAAMEETRRLGSGETAQTSLSVGRC